MKELFVGKLFPYVTAFSFMAHIFCCGLPVLALFVSVGATAGVGYALTDNPVYSFVNAYHPVFLGLAAFTVFCMALVVAYTHFKNHEEGSCKCSAVGKVAIGKKPGFRILALSVTLLVLDIAWFLAEENFFHLHHTH